jgi:hypothetical protein
MSGRAPLSWPPVGRDLAIRSQIERVIPDGSALPKGAR